MSAAGTASSPGGNGAQAISPDAAVAAAFGGSLQIVYQTLAWLHGPEAAALSHAELEEHIARRGQEYMRRSTQDHLDLRAAREREAARVEVVDAAGVVYGAVEERHHRPLTTVFGTVTVERRAHRHRGEANLYPADAALNLPEELHSHGLRHLAAIESTRGSFEEAAEAIERATGVHVAKRQVEALTARAATDVVAFYDTFAPEPGDSTDVLVLSADGKGIVMRPGSLRHATQKAAEAATPKLQTRLCKGEKANRKRMATVGAVYDITPVVRSPDDILVSKAGAEPPPAPRAKAKWVTASVDQDTAHVMSKIFDEADRRDPSHQRSWVALVDGANHQIDCIHAQADAREVTVTIVVDIIHVMEHLWDGARCFFPETDPAGEAWVRDRTQAVLGGGALDVAAGIRRRATTQRLSKSKRKQADECATYLTNKAPYLDYPQALAAGWPIATGVIEGTCRYLVADRLDITGARWSVDGAEDVLKLRAVRANGHFDAYFRWHLEQEGRRVHQSRYAGGDLPIAA